MLNANVYKMKTYCNIYVDDEKKGTCGNYDEALRWVKENYSHILPYLTWEPKGAGGVDRWDNEVNSIMIEKYYPDGIDLHYIIQQHRKEKKIYDEKEEIEEQIDQEAEKAIKKIESELGDIENIKELKKLKDLF